MSDATLFAGRTAVITGGARGLGFAMATALAEHGANIALLDVLESADSSAAALATATGVQSVGTYVDVTDPASISEALDTVEARLGTASVLVNAAGISLGVPALETTPAQWQRIMDVNLNGTFFTAQDFARRAAASGTKATIVNVSSMSSFIVNIPQTQTAYNVSKAAVAMLTQSLAIEWLPMGIRVNAIAPGYFASDMTKDFVANNPSMATEWIEKIPFGRMGEPAELGDLVVYLASERSAYMVGQNIKIDGGYTIV